MLANVETAVSRLVLLNALLGVACLLLVLTVVGGVVYELYMRRKIRRSLPKGWPPDAPPARRVVQRAVRPANWPPRLEETHS
jgi:hypothetical protein